MDESVHELGFGPGHAIITAKTGITDLPHDLFLVVIGKLVDISDFIRIRATCKRWRHLLSLSDSPRLPWIFNRCLISLSASLEFYSVASGHFHTLHVPKASGKFLAGPSSQGYLLAFDPRSFALSLLNPLTCNEIPLPLLELKRGALSSFFRPELLCTGDIMAISGFSSQSILVLASCRSGDTKWTTVERQVYTNLDVGRTYHKGMYFVNETETGATTAIDATIGTVVFYVPAPQYRYLNTPKGPHQELKGYSYLIESGGEVLRVFQLRDDYNALTSAYFEIFQLDYAERGCPRWVGVNSIGDRMLFIDSVHGLSVMNSSGFAAGLKGNSIYFIKLFFLNDTNCWSKFLCRYDVSNGTTQVLPFSVEKLWGGPWIVPSLQ